MLKSFKFGIGNGKQIPAIVLMLVAAMSPVRLHAEDRHVAMARLQIQVNVIPTLVAAQQAARMEAQPSQSPVTFNLAPQSKQNSNLSTRSITITAANGSEQTAVLKTTTLVSE